MEAREESVRTYIVAGLNSAHRNSIVTDDAVKKLLETRDQ